MPNQRPFPSKNIWFFLLSLGLMFPGRAIPLQTPANGTCFVYPSPATSNSAWVVYDMPQPGTAQILVYNEAGSLTSVVQVVNPAGVAQTALDLSQYRNGLYLCRVVLTLNSGGIQLVQPFKFVVNK